MSCPNFLENMWSRTGGHYEEFCCRCLFEFEGVFFIQNWVFFAFVRKCTETIIFCKKVWRPGKARNFKFFQNRVREGWLAHAIYFQSAAGPSGRLLASYRGGSTDGVLPHPAVGALPNPAVGEPGSCFSVPWPSFSCLPCYDCRCLLEFEGVFYWKLRFFWFRKKMHRNDHF